MHKEREEEMRMHPLNILSGVPPCMNVKQLTLNNPLTGEVLGMTFYYKLPT